MAGIKLKTLYILSIHQIIAYVEMFLYKLTVFSLCRTKKNKIISRNLWSQQTFASIRLTLLNPVNEDTLCPYVLCCCPLPVL